MGKEQLLKATGETDLATQIETVLTGDGHTHEHNHALLVAMDELLTEIIRDLNQPKAPSPLKNLIRTKKL